MSGIRTRTLAEIYARQGHLERACAIYEELLAEQPGDPELTTRLATLRRTMEAREAEDGQHARVEALRALLRRVRARRRSP